jgi:hypothetical protein
LRAPNIFIDWESNMTDVGLFLSKTLFLSCIFVLLAATDVADVTSREAVTSVPHAAVADIVPAFSGESFRTGVTVVSDITLRGTEEAPDATAVTGSITGLLRPATSGAAEAQPQSVALADLCRADLRANVCRGAESGHRRTRAKLRAMLKRDQGLSTVTKSEEIGEPVRPERAGACVEGKPCAVPVVEQGATVVSVAYRPEETVPEDLTASLAPIRMVGGMMIKTYR